MLNLKNTIMATLILTFSAGAMAAGSGLNSEELKLKPVEKLNVKEPARSRLKSTMAPQTLGLNAQPQAAASQSSSQKENLNKAAYLKKLATPGKPALGGEGGSSGSNPPQGCLNCSN